MFKSALVIFFSVAFIFFSAPAIAVDDSTAGISTSKKQKKSHVSKSRTSKASHGKHHARNAHGARPTRLASGKLVRKVVLVNGKRKVVYQRLAKTEPMDPISAGDLAGLKHTPDALDLKSNVALVLDQSNSEVLFEKNSGIALPIASITKLMTGLVVVEANQDMDEVLTVTDEDVDREKFSTSRLRVGAKLTRTNMLHIALMSSENRAASALGRNYPGGLSAFVAAMNAKAAQLGMSGTHYVDSTGLSSQNVATAHDLAKLVIAAHEQPLLCQYSTDTKYVVDAGGRQLQYQSSNRLVANPGWEIGLQKTGYIAEAGRCLVMQAKIAGRAVIMVFLDSKGKYSRLADADRIRDWLAIQKPQT